MADNATFASLKLSCNTNMNCFTFKDKKIHVLQYLPIKEKYDIITAVLAGSLQDGVYSPVLTDMLFKVYLVYSYTDISFTAKQKEDPFKIYDLLESNGFFKDDAFMGAVNKEEIENLYSYIISVQGDRGYYNTSFPAAIKVLCEALPKNAEAAVKIVEEFNPEKYKEVINFSKAANGGRALTTNE